VDVTIGTAVPGDADVLTALHHRAALVAFAHIFPSDAPAPDVEIDRAHWADCLSAGDVRAHVARGEDGRIVGVVLAGPDPDDGRPGHLSRFYVDPDHWGEGIGTELYATAIGETGAALRRRDAVGPRRQPSGSPRRLTTFAPAGIDDVQYRIDLSP